ncbi:hypothetical protein BS78_01G247500 [Paspalum vaginatum]|uniref:NAC domain-containing protein n=1 Tax=Paspalum vaginatum TaxID=158149 RepID=A0A9W7XA58_9POAL|nr:hypothetical protein BS78_K315000 [Paspalum vaginatum]KAJ1295759.1 hypothetical protein BS78_01G247500 [Paspalum vaginatum]
MTQQRAISVGSLITKHGFPSGVRFVPTDMELVSILSDRVRGVPLRPRVAAVFHDVDILDYHPKELHEMYRHDTEYRYIYFFSCRRFQTPAQGGDQRAAAVFFPEDEHQKEPRPVRVAKGGGWKPSGGARPLRLPPRQGGFVVGKMVSMVFYDEAQGAGKGKKQVKSNWGMHEVTIPVKRELTDIESSTRFYNLALYRLYVLKSGDVEAENRRAAAGGTGKNAVSDNCSSTAVVPCPVPRAPLRISTENQTAAVGASTSSMPPPQLRLSAQHQQRAHCYHRQHASFGAAQQQQQQLHATMAPVHGGSIRQPALLFPLAPPPPTAPHGAGQQFGCLGGGAFTSSPYLAPLPMSTTPMLVPLPANNMNPPVEVEQMAPATGDTTHGAGQEAAGHLGVTASPPAAPSGSSQSEQHASATTEPTAEEVPPPLEEDFVPAAQDERADDADIYGGLPDLWNPNLVFTLEELMGEPAASDEPAALPMQGGNNRGRDENPSLY